MRLDADDLDEAIASAACIPAAGRQVATDAQIARLRGDLARLVVILPGELTIREVRGFLALEPDEDDYAPRL
jgi:hypothetical protein